MNKVKKVFAAVAMIACMCLSVSCSKDDANKAKEGVNKAANKAKGAVDEASKKMNDAKKD